VTGEWTTFSTDRQDRTFLPVTEDCPLCPTRDPDRPTEVPAGDWQIAVFDNRWPALRADPPEPAVAGDDLFQVEPAVGAAEVVVFSPDHDASTATLSPEHLRLLVDVWAERYADLGSRPEVVYVFAFENRGEAIGVTLHHPHGQVYGYPDLPPRVLAQLTGARRHWQATGRCVWCDVVSAEEASAQRVVFTSERWTAYVPFAARYPYELHLTSRRHVPDLLALDDAGRHDLACSLSRVARAYDSLFGFPLPYVMSVHQRPTDGGDWADVTHLHVEFAPLHRTATKLKYLAGSETGAGAFIADVAPEAAAAELRALL
jgi:UDPglucose--hexose-1-phosphate uridylyltransferase